MKITKWAYEHLISADIAWLLANTEDTLERRHIVSVLKDSPNQYYKDTANNEMFRGIPQSRINQISVLNEIQMACPHTICVTEHGESKCLCKLELERKETEENKNG